MDLCDGGDLGLGDRRDLESARARGERGDRRDLDGARARGERGDRRDLDSARARGDLCDGDGRDLDDPRAHGNLFDGRDLDGARARGDLGDCRDLDSARSRGDLGDGRGSMDRIRSSLQHWNSTIRGDHGQPSGKTARHDLQGLVNKDINRVWNHGSKFEGGFHCQYCNLRKRGGGATRFKEHLGHVVGEVRECPNVPRNVKDLMKNAVYETRNKKRKKATDKLRLEREIMDGLYHREGVINIDDDDDAELQMAIRESLSDKNVSRAVERRRGSGSGVRVSVGKSSIATFFNKELSSNKVSMQPKITTSFDLESRDVLGQSWAKNFHANDIAGLKADCPYFRAAMKITQKLGPIPLPTAKEIDGIYLDKNYDEAVEWLKIFKQDWKNFGVTVMCDSWTGPTGMSVINFMVYCNEKMFFHKSIDASGQTQNSEFIYRQIKKVVVDEIGHENVVQIITDNGSNYKKACKTLVEQPEYNHIVWQPCAAHTINLMLKDIAKFPEVDVIVKSAKQICRFFHNHNNLHDSMKKNVGGELIKPNATRFGTVFMFLESYHEKKDQFRKWMVSDDWKKSIWRKDADYVFSEALLSSNMWWAALEWVLNLLEPLYNALRYADTQKQCTLSGFKKSMMTAVQTLESRLGGGSEMLRRVMSKVSHRIEAMEKDTLMVAAAVLDPNTHYVVNLSNIPEFASALTVAIEKIADPDSAALAIYEISAFRERHGRFGQRVAHISAEKMSPTEWWFQFGGDVPNLQKYALRIVSQCVSSSGCERNWSAWALVHTKQRNRLLYGKLHKFVSVRHNLKIRAEEDKDRVRENDKYKEVDPCAMMMNTTMFDEANPMMEWLNEDEEHVILDGSDAASAVFEEIRRLNSSKKSSHLGRKGNGTKRKRVLEEDEDDYIDCDDDEEEDEYIDIDDEDECGDDSASEADGEDSTTRVEKDQPSQDGNEVEERNDGGLLNCRRSRRGKQSTKLKDLTSLYN